MSSYAPSYGYKGSSSLSKSSGSGYARNYIFVHSAEQTCHYLMPTHAQIVLFVERLATGDDTQKNGPVQWLYCHIVDTDTNHDGRLTEEDGFSVAFANPDGTQVKTVLQGVSKLLGRTRLSGDRILIFYTSEDKSWMSEVNIAERSVARTQELPASP